MVNCPLSCTGILVVVSVHFTNMRIAPIVLLILVIACAEQPQDSAEMEMAETDAEAEEVAEELSDLGDGAKPARPEFKDRGQPEPPYKVFTTAHDEVVDASELCDAEELERLRAYLDQQLTALSSIVSRLANKLQRRLLAQQSRATALHQYIRLLAGQALVEGIDLEGAETPLVQ